MRLINEKLETRYWKHRRHAIAAAKELAGVDARKITERSYEDRDGWTFTVGRTDGGNFFIQLYDEEGYRMQSWSEDIRRNHR